MPFNRRFDPLRLNADVCTSAEFVLKKVPSQSNVNAANTIISVVPSFAEAVRGNPLKTPDIADNCDLLRDDKFQIWKPAMLFLSVSSDVKKASPKSGSARNRFLLKL